MDAEIKELRGQVKDLTARNMVLQMAHRALVERFHEAVHPDKARVWSECGAPECRRSKFLLVRPTEAPAAGE